MDVFKSILIAGGGGMLACDVAGVLRGRGYHPVALTRADCDVTRAEHINAVFEKYRPTLLINCAAHTAVDLCENEPDKAFAINGTGVGLLARACVRHGTKLVHYSTDFVFDGQNDRPYRPNDPTHPVSVYGASKLSGEKQLKETLSLSWLAIRTAWLFGRHGSCFPATMVQLARANKTLRIVNDQVGCPTYTIDLAEATLDLIQHEATGLFHICNQQPVTWYEFAVASLGAFGIRHEISPISTQDWLRLRPKQAKRPAYSVLDVSDYENLTGRRMRDWRDGLRDYRAAFVNVPDFSQASQKCDDVNRVKL